MYIVIGMLQNIFWYTGISPWTHVEIVNKNNKIVFLLAYLSWKLKWAFLITCCPLSVRLSVRPSVCLSSSSPEPLGQFQPNMAKSILGWRGSNEGPHPFPRGDNNEIVKIHWRNLKIFFFRSKESISTKFGTNKASLGEKDSILFKWRAPLFSKGR